MKIISLYVKNFGQLCNFSLDIDKERTIVYEKNGFGKSTLAAFIKAMFYGLSTTKTNLFAGKNDEPETELKRWCPWGHKGDFGGSLTFEHNDKKRYRIERYFSVSPRKDECVVIDLQTNRQTKEINLGEKLFSLSANAFSRCFFVPQDEVMLSNDETVTSKLSGMTEGTECDKAISLLTEYRRNLDSTRGGAKLKAKEKEREVVYSRLGKAKKASDEVLVLEENLKQAALQKTVLDRKTEEITREREALAKQQTALVDVTKLAEVKGALAKNEAELSSKKRFQNAVEEASRAERLLNEAKKKNKINVPLLLLGILLAVLVVGVFLIKKALNGESKQLYKDLDELLERNSVAVKDGDYPKAIRELREKGEQYFACYGENQRLKAVADTLSQNTEDFALNEKRERVERKVRELSAERERLATNTAVLEERKRNAENHEDVSALQSELNKCEEDISEIKHQCVVADKAVELLRQAKEEIASSYLPKLSKAAEKNMQLLTGNGSLVLSCDNDFSLSVTENGVTKKSEFYSQGLQEIAVFSFRLALSEMLYKDKIPFLLIDDAFVNYDEERFSSVMKLLKELSEETQVIYFTCHSRGEKLLR